MAQPATNAKIEELRFRLKTDPKSRLFYQLAEELRRAAQFGEAEQVLRSGLSVYPTYLAAWVSLGRVLRDLRNEGAAIEALGKAMQLDPGNVVAARLLADAHLALGDRLEAVKKYKLVHALMPGDEELKATIDQLDRELHPPAAHPEPEPEAAIPFEAHSLPEPQLEAPDPELEPTVEQPIPSPPFVTGEPMEQPIESSRFAVQEPLAPSAFAIEESPFDKTVPPFAESTGDAEPMLAAHQESPFEEPVEGATMDAFAVEQPPGMHIVSAPDEAEFSEEDVFDGAGEEPAIAEQVTDTSTMADLYARQGLVSEAQHIYENILAREPGNAGVRAKLEALTPRVNPRVNQKVEKLERWLGKVGRKEVGRV